MTSSDRFPLTVRSAVKSNLAVWCSQHLSNHALNALRVQALALHLWSLSLGHQHPHYEYLIILFSVRRDNRDRWRLAVSVIISVGHTDNNISCQCSPHWYKFYYQCGVDGATLFSKLLLKPLKLNWSNPNPNPTKPYWTLIFVRTLLTPRIIFFPNL